MSQQPEMLTYGEVRQIETFMKAFGKASEILGHDNGGALQVNTASVEITSSPPNRVLGRVEFIEGISELQFLPSMRK